MNIAIAGAGLVGRVLALALLKDNEHSITMFEKDSKEGISSAGFTAAGMLAPFSELETAESIISQLGQISIRLWPSLLKEIGLCDGYEQNGSIITAHPQDMSELEHFIGRLKQKTDVSQSIESLDQEALKSLEPALYSHQKGFLVKNEGVIDAQRFISFSNDYFDKQANITIQEQTEVKSIGAHKVHLLNSTEQFDWVFDARGLGAKEYFEDLRGVRGEVLWVETDEININRPTRIMHPRYKIYIVPRNNDSKANSTTGTKRYIIGATEIESEDLSPISVRSTMELLSALYTVHPSFGEARVVISETNCRPAFRDNLPRIENKKGLTRINGLYRHGWLLAPAIIEKALDEGIRNKG
ncbi:MAG: FAD-dependent oxidoreductase [Sulfurovum sp.]|nr:FAD-dependent oxidoreductase [Sulfurovum sp.]